MKKSMIQKPTLAEICYTGIVDLFQFNVGLTVQVSPLNFKRGSRQPHT